MKKRLLKFWGALLAVCVLSTCATVTVLATGEFKKDSPAFELSVLSVQKMEESYDSDSPDIHSVRPGDTLIVTVGFRNHGEERVKLTGAAFFLEYDERYVEPEDADFERNDDLNWSMTVIHPENFHVLAATGFGDACEAAAGEAVFLNRFAFRVREDAEEVETAFNLVSFQGYDSGLLDENNDSIPLEISGHTLNIRKIRLKSVTLSEEEVSVNGKGSAQTVQAVAEDEDGNIITEGLLWSVYPEECGVEIDAQTGVITVSPDAVGDDYEIMVEPAEGVTSFTGEAYAELFVESESDIPAPVAGYSGIVLKVNQANRGNTYIASVLRDGVPVDPDDVQPGDRVTIAHQAKGRYTNIVRVSDDKGKRVSIHKIDDGSSWFDMPSAMPVTITVTYTLTSGSGGDAPPAMLYSIQISPSPNGKITCAPSFPRTGEQVTITVTPNVGYTLTEVTVLESNGNRISVGLDLTFTMPASNVTISATFVSASSGGTEYGGISILLDPVIPPVKSPFSDVKEKSTLYNDITWTCQNRLMMGYTDGTYLPAKEVSSRTIVIVLARMENPDLRESLSETGYGPYEEWAAAHNAPMKDVPFSRGEMAKLLSGYLRSQRPNYAPSHVAGFSDADSVWEDGEQEAFRDLVGAGIVYGTSDGTMNPRGYVTRAQLSAFIHRLYRFLKA